jgi:hypothetical protein
MPPLRLVLGRREAVAVRLEEADGSPALGARVTPEWVRGTRPATSSSRATGSAGGAAALSAKAKKVAARKPAAKKNASRKKRVAPAKRLRGKQPPKS